MSKQYFVYIISNKKLGTLYIGFTSNLEKRIWEHKNKVIDGFSKKYNLNRLVYFEVHDNPESAIKREKRLKLYLRKWKIELIENENPEWRDLYKEFYRSFDQVEG